MTEQTSEPRTDMTPEDFWRAVGEWAVEQGIWKPEAEAAALAARPAEAHGVSMVDRLGITCLCEWTTFFDQGGWIDFNRHLAEAAALPAASGPWPKYRPDYGRIAAAVSTHHTIDQAVAWIEEEGQRDLRPAAPAGLDARHEVHWVDAGRDEPPENGYWACTCGQTFAPDGVDEFARHLAAAYAEGEPDDA